MKKSNKPFAEVNQPEPLYNVVESGRIVFTGTRTQIRAYYSENY